MAGRCDNPIWRYTWPARLHRLAESIPWNRFLGSNLGLVRNYFLPSTNDGMSSLSFSSVRLRGVGGGARGRRLVSFLSCLCNVHLRRVHYSRARIWKLLRSPGINSQTSRIDSLESNPGLLKRLQIRAQFSKSLINRYGFLAVFLLSKPLPHADWTCAVVILWYPSFHNFRRLYSLIMI
jgi:hypothetical protein